jgi:DNA-binding response OmpR family regulator
VTPDDPVDGRVAGGAPAGGPRRPAGRPRRATPHRRPPTDAQPPAEPSPEEPADSADWLVVGRLRLSRSAGEVYLGSRRISLTRTEFAVLELLMTRGGHGVTRDAIRAAAASTNGNGEEPLDLDEMMAELRRKTGLRGRGVRSERALVYFFRE